jgi:hypothetical protein
VGEKGQARLQLTFKAEAFVRKRVPISAAGVDWVRGDVEPVLDLSVAWLRCPEGIDELVITFMRRGGRIETAGPLTHFSFGSYNGESRLERQKEDGAY